MAWRTGLAVLLLACCSAVEARHSFSALSPRNASPGIGFELVRLPAAASGPVRYSLRTSGFPSGLAIGVWTRYFGQDFEQRIPSVGFDAAGVPVALDSSDGRRKGQPIEIDPGPYPKGAAWTVALASDDHQVSAFARVIPWPIESRDGTCTVSLELISLHGNRFLASGSGFVPGENARVESTSLGKTTYRVLVVSADGTLPPDVVTHGAISADLSARYAVKGAKCGPVVEYQYGDAALKRY
jgi:hypothetical protein